jgi:hypothetical protein
MHLATVLFLSLTMLLTALALAREVRLRRALQRLVRALLARFHPKESARQSKTRPDPTSIDRPKKTDTPRLEKVLQNRDFQLWGVSLFLR